jgi:hypothetical protein
MNCIIKSDEGEDADVEEVSEESVVAVVIVSPAAAAVVLPEVVLSGIAGSDEVLVDSPRSVAGGSVASVVVADSSVGPVRVTTSLLYTEPSLEEGLLLTARSLFLGKITPSETESAITAMRKVE